MEIERKFLIEHIPFPLDAYTRASIRQGYISTDPTIRLRRRDAAFILTVKGRGHMAREEFELELSEEQFTELWRKVESGVIEKTRYYIPHEGGKTIELDVFDGKLSGLTMAEVEFLTAEEAEGFTPPAWFGRDVTFDRRYKNSSLSLDGLPKD